MGNVYLKYRIMPEDVSQDPQTFIPYVEEIVKKYGKIHGLKVLPVAFGLKALVVEIIVPDAGGIVDRIEEELKNIPKVSQIDCEQVTLI